MSKHAQNNANWVGETKAGVQRRQDFPARAFVVKGRRDSKHETFGSGGRRTRELLRRKKSLHAKQLRQKEERSRRFHTVQIVPNFAIFDKRSVTDL